MPVTKSATKKLKQDRKKTAVNNKIKKKLTDTVKGVKKSKKATLEEAYSKIDKAAKKGIVHSNKAARMKSKLSKVAPKESQSTSKTKNTPTKKNAPKKSKSTK